MPQKTHALGTARVFADHEALLGAGLARPGDLASLRAIAGMLPDVCHAGFECPLGDDEPGVDFLYCLRRAEESRHLLDAPPDDGAWSRLRRFAACWRQEGELARIPNAWLEFDLRARQAAVVPAPSLFVNTPVSTTADYDAAIDRLADLLGCARSAATRAAMIRLHEVLGPVSAACETGFWLSRPTAALRMVFVGIEASSETVVALLDRAGHPGPAVLREAPLPALWPAGGSVSVALDVADDVAPGCAVELYPLPPDRAFPAADHAIAQGRLLERLASFGLCTDARRRQVTGWAGDLDYGDDPEIDARLLLRRAVNHVKLSIRRGRRVSAKAYLSLTGLALRQQATAHAPA